MKVVRNTLAFIGLLALALAGFVYVQGANLLRSYDAEAPRVLADFVRKALDTDIATATVVTMPLRQGVSIQDAIDSMKLRANALNIKLVGEKPLYKEIEAITGKPYRHVEILEFCDAVTAGTMLTFNPVFVAYMPCRIALYEDARGRVWLATTNMDLLVHGGKELPHGLKEQALHIRDGLMEIMQAGANGEL
jgi:uncharacterized protein DUF302